MKQAEEIIMKYRKQHAGLWLKLAFLYKKTVVFTANENPAVFHDYVAITINLRFQLSGFFN